MPSLGGESSNYIMLTGVGPNQPPFYLKVCSLPGLNQPPFYCKVYSLQGRHFYLGLGLILRNHYYLLHMKHFLSAECFGISFYQLLSILKSKQSPGPGGRWQTPRFTESSPCRGPLAPSCDRSKESSQNKSTMRSKPGSMRTPGSMSGVRATLDLRIYPLELFERAVVVPSVVLRKCN